VSGSGRPGSRLVSIGRRCHSVPALGTKRLVAWPERVQE
jgi:hypothetical protein